MARAVEVSVVWRAGEMSMEVAALMVVVVMGMVAVAMMAAATWVGAVRVASWVAAPWVVVKVVVAARAAGPHLFSLHTPPYGLTSPGRDLNITT